MTQNTPFLAPATTDTVALTQLVLSFFERLMVAEPADPSKQQRGPGHPETLQISHILLSCLLMILRGTFALADVHRSLLNETIGSFAPLISFSRQAVRQRLIALQLRPFTELLHQVADVLSQREPHASALSLAPFAPVIVAVDETRVGFGYSSV